MNTRMVIAGAVLAAGAFLAAPGVSAPANAQPLSDGEYGYVEDLVHAGLGEYDAAQAFTLGYLTCASPLPLTEQAAVVWRNTALDIDWADSVAIVNAAHRNLCPGQSA